MTELEGFELFRAKEETCFIIARTKAVAISHDTYIALDKPEYVLVYTDDVKMRVLIKVVDQRYENALKVVTHSQHKNPETKNMSLCCRALAIKIAEMFGKSVRVYGHLVNDGVMVFDKVEKHHE